MKAFRCDICNEFYIPHIKVLLPNEDKSSEVKYTFEFHRLEPTAFYGTNIDICLKCVKQLYGYGPVNDPS